MSYCHVRVSDEEIYSPVVLRATTLVLMSQDSLRQFRNSLDDSGIALVNSSLVRVDETFAKHKHILIPATETASELGDVRAANMIMLGVYDEVRQFGLDKQLDACLEKAFPGKKGTFRDINLRAIEAGRKLYRKTLSRQGTSTPGTFA